MGVKDQGNRVGFTTLTAACIKTLCEVARLGCSLHSDIRQAVSPGYDSRCAAVAPTRAYPEWADAWSAGSHVTRVTRTPAAFHAMVVTS